MLDPYTGATVDRATFNAVLSSAMPPRFSEAAYTYLDSGGIIEVFKPIFGMSQMIGRDQEHQLRDIFELIREVMAPRSKRTYDQLAKRTRTYLTYDTLLTDFPPNDLIRTKLSDRQREKVEEAKILFYRQTSSRSGPEFLAWLDNKREDHACATARFSFRESFDPPDAMIYDPKHQLSSNDVVRYDAFHVVQNYEAEWFDSAAEWMAMLPSPMMSPRPEAEDKLFCVLNVMRPAGQRPTVRFRLHQGTHTRSSWEDRYCYHEAAIKGLEPYADGVKLSPVLSRAFQKQYVPLFAGRLDTRVASSLKQLCYSEGWIGRDLEVTFADGTTHTYIVVLGTAMFFAAARLRAASAAQQKTNASGEAGWII